MKRIASQISGFALLGLALTACSSSGLSGRDGPGVGVTSTLSSSGVNVTENAGLNLQVTEVFNEENPERVLISGLPSGTISAPFFGSDRGDGNYYGFTEATNPTTVVFLSNSERLELEYSSYGYWVAEPASGVLEIGGGGFGARTESGSLPTGSATYTGQSIGTVVTSVNAESIISDIQVTTDFSNVDITSTNARALVGGATFSNVEFTGSGTVNGQSYSGTAMTNNGIDGVFNGQFNGPAGEETSGGFGFGNGFTIYNGGFGAKQ